VAGGGPLPRVARCGVDSNRYDLAVQPPLAGRERSPLWHRAEDHRLRQHYRGLGSYEFSCRESTAGLPSTRTANNAAATTPQPFVPASQVSIFAGKPLLSRILTYQRRGSSGGILCHQHRPSGRQLWDTQCRRCRCRARIARLPSGAACELRIAHGVTAPAAPPSGMRNHYG
jgi:hypothetical protein